MFQFSCQEYSHKFSGISGREIEISHFLQIACLHASLFTDLACGTFFKRFLFIACAGREFEQILLSRVAILTDKKQISIIINWNKYNRATMLNDFKFGFVSIGSFKIITFDLEGASL